MRTAGRPQVLVADFLALIAGAPAAAAGTAAQVYYVPLPEEQVHAALTDVFPGNGEAYRGSGQYVLNGNGTRLGPYSDAVATHQFLQSPFHRQAELCQTCHDVSNAAVGDLAHNNGTQYLPLAAGHFRGVLGSSVAGKAAFNNPPYKYGVVERTSSEHVASAFDTLRVSDFYTLPADLRVTGGSIQRAYQRAMDQTGNASRPNYKDGTVRYYTCQTCHMAASPGKGCNKNNVPTREDLPRHDQTGAAHWVTDAIKYMDTKGTLRLGGGLTQLLLQKAPAPLIETRGSERRSRAGQQDQSLRIGFHAPGKPGQASGTTTTRAITCSPLFRAVRGRTPSSRSVISL